MFIRNKKKAQRANTPLTAYHTVVSSDKTGFQKTANCDSWDFEIFLSSNKNVLLRLSCTACKQLSYEWSSQLYTQFKQLQREAWKNTLSGLKEQTFRLQRDGNLFTWPLWCSTGQQGGHIRCTRCTLHVVALFIKQYVILNTLHVAALIL
mgnify:CR=1 FL=1